MDERTENPLKLVDGETVSFAPPAPTLSLIERVTINRIHVELQKCVKPEFQSYGEAYLAYLIGESTKIPSCMTYRMTPEQGDALVYMVNTLLGLPPLIMPGVNK